MKRVVNEARKVQADLAGTGCTLPQAALKFVLAHEAVSVTIPGMRNVAQVDANTADLPDMKPEVLQKLHAHNWLRGFWYDGR